MKKNYLSKSIMLLSLMFLSTVAAYSQNVELVWNDEFDYTGSPDASKWIVQTGGGGWGNQELQNYTNRDTNLYVENGVLTITTLEEVYGSNNYTSARLTTQNLHAWKHGRIEARLKLPTGRAMWPAFWAMGANIDEVSWPACGEIDILEVFCDGGKNDSLVLNTAHWEENGTHVSYGSGVWNAHMKPFHNPSPQEFHIYAMEWYETGEMEFYVDDVLTFNMAINSGMSEFHQEFFLILNLAVGGNKFPFNYPNVYYPDNTVNWPQTLVADYVRVYSDPSYHAMSGDTIAVKGQANMLFSMPYDTSFIYNWTVPTGATLVGGSVDSNIVIVNWGCSSDTIECELTTISGTYNLKKEVQIIEQSIISDSYFVDSNEVGVVFSVTEIADAKYQWSVPADASIAGSDSSSSVIVNWGISDGEVICEIKGLCDTVSVTKLIRIEGRQFPYPNPNIAHILPGSIESTDFDYGGEGLAYHDLGSTNQGSGPRSDEGVDTEYGDDNGPNVGWTSVGEWLEYTIQVEDTIELFIELRVASLSGGGPLSILINGENRMGALSIPRTGSWAVFNSFYAGAITLYPSDTILRYEIGGAGFNIGKLTTHDRDKTNPSAIGNLNVVPSATSANVTWDAATDDILLLEYDVYLDGVFYTTVSSNSATITGLSQETNYSVEVFAVDWQGNLSTGVSADFTTATSSGKEILSNELVKIFPNPAQDNLNIESELSINRIIICDYLGRQLIESTQNGGSINISSLSTGVYYMILDIGTNGRIIERFTKK